jgi:hypothetical protein
MRAREEEPAIRIQSHLAVAEWVEEVLTRLRKMGETIEYPVLAEEAAAGRVLMLQTSAEVAAWDRMGPGFVAAGILRLAPRELFLGDVERVFFEASVPRFPVLFLTSPALRWAADRVIGDARVRPVRPTDRN